MFKRLSLFALCMSQNVTALDGVQWYHTLGACHCYSGTVGGTFLSRSCILVIQQQSLIPSLTTGNFASRSSLK